MGEQSHSLEHAAVGGPGTDKPVSANSLNPISKMICAWESHP